MEEETKLDDEVHTDTPTDIPDDSEKDDGAGIGVPAGAVGSEEK